MPKLTREERKLELQENIELMKQEVDRVGEQIMRLTKRKEQRKKEQKMSSLMCAPWSPKEEKPEIKTLAEELIILSSQCIGVAFNDVSQLSVSKKLVVYQGKGKTDYITFKFQVEVEEECYVKDVIFEFEDEFLETVLGQWRRKFIRERNFQILIKGCSVYSELFSRMSDTLNWLFEEYYTLYSVKKSDLSGTVIRSKRKDADTDAPSVTVHWRITWKDNEYTMGDQFVIEIPDDGIFDEDTRHNWKIFTEQVMYTTDDIKKFWTSVSTNIF